MNLTVRVLGAEVLAISIDRTGPEQGCDSTSYPVGFVGSHGDARWEKGVETA